MPVHPRLLRIPSQERTSEREPTLRVWGPTESDMSETTEYACMKMRSDSTAKEFRINTEEAGGLEQRITEKHVPEPKNKARENATEQTERVIGSAGSRGRFLTSSDVSGSAAVG